jgi:hypothetical protein
VFGWVMAILIGLGNVPTAPHIDGQRQSLSGYWAFGFNDRTYAVSYVGDLNRMFSNMVRGIVVGDEGDNAGEQHAMLNKGSSLLKTNAPFLPRCFFSGKKCPRHETTGFTMFFGLLDRLVQERIIRDAADKNFHVGSGRIAIILDENDDGERALVSPHKLSFSVNSDRYIQPRAHSISGGARALFGMVGGESGVNRRADGSGHRDEAKRGPDGGNPCVAESEDHTCIGGLRRTSVLYQIVCIGLTLILGALAGVGIANGFPPSGNPKPVWLASGLIGMLGGGIFLIAAVDGNLWLFGL